MRERWRRLAQYLVAPEDATPLALARILACGALFVHLARALASGAARFAWSHVDDGGLSVSALSRALGSDGVIVFVSALALAALCAALGVFTRPALLASFIGLRVLTEITPIARGGYDRLLINVLFLLLLSGCGAALALGRRGPAGTSMRFVRVLMVFQLTLLYLSGGLYKLSWSWLPGGDASALWYALQQPLWARFADPLPAWSALPLALATTSVWLFEVGAPLFFLAFVLDERGSTSWVARALRRVHFRTLYLAFGFLMHLGIEALMEIGPFGWVTLSLYPAALAPDALQRVWQRVRQRVRSPSPTASARS